MSDSDDESSDSVGSLADFIVPDSDEVASEDSATESNDEDDFLSILDVTPGDIAAGAAMAAAMAAATTRAAQSGEDDPDDLPLGIWVDETDTETDSEETGSETGNEPEPEPELEAEADSEETGSETGNEPEPEPELEAEAEAEASAVARAGVGAPIRSALGRIARAGVRALLQHIETPDAPLALPRSDECLEAAAGSEADWFPPGTPPGHRDEHRNEHGSEHGSEEMTADEEAESKADVDDGTKNAKCASPSAKRPRVDQPSSLRRMQQWPACFLCPITQQPFVDPVVCPEGHSFERAAIAKWLAKKDTHPLSRNKLKMGRLRPNRNLQAAVRRLTTLFS
jgi:hypothetical protein